MSDILDNKTVASIEVKTTYPRMSRSEAEEIVYEAIEDDNIQDFTLFREGMEESAYVLVETDIAEIEAELTFEEKQISTDDSFTTQVIS